jgi:perosamine synthetase
MFAVQHALSLGLQPPLFVVGVGKHAEVVADAAIQCGHSDVKFCSYLDGTATATLPSLSEAVRSRYAGTVDEVLSISPEATFVVGIGCNSARAELVDRHPGLTYVNIVHSRATVLSSVLGVGNVVLVGAIIQTGCTVGSHNIFNTGSSVDHHNEVQDFCHVAPKATLCGSVTLFDGCFVGAGAVVVPGVTLRPWSFVKANETVKFGTNIISIYEPELSKYKKSAIEAIESGSISFQGKFPAMTMQKLKELLGTPYVVLCCNGTVATHCLFIALMHMHPGIRKIYVPNNVYVAAWNCALMEYKQSNLEVLRMSPDTWNMCTDDIYINSLDRDSAVLVVHNVGNIVDVPRLKRLRPDLVFVEDNCEGLFGKYDGVYTGAHEASLCSAVSFFANKSITSGEGGAFFTTNEALYTHIHAVCHQGVTSVRYLHNVHAYNYRMSNIQAALLYDQLCDISAILERKQRLFAVYDQLLDELFKEGVLVPQRTEPGTSRANWMYAVRIVNLQNFGAIDTFFHSKGCDLRPMFLTINTHAHLATIKFADSGAELLAREVVMLPSSPGIKRDEQVHVARLLTHYVRSLGLV